MQFILIILGISAIVFMLYCYETAQLVDESFKPLEPIKKLKDADKTSLVLYLAIFFLIVYLVSELLYPNVSF